jgi:phage terminase small subunit
MKPPANLDSYGPAMRVLTPLQRAFVEAWVENPVINGRQAALRAGYSGHKGAERVQAHMNLRNERVLAAIREETDKRLRSCAPLGAAVLVEIVNNPDHPKRLKAAELLLNHGGFHTMHEQRIKVEHSDLTGEAMVERIRQFAVALGMDPQQVLGVNAPGAKLIEAKVEKDDAV